VRYGDPIAGRVMATRHDRRCAVRGCDRRARARVWCHMHYVRWRKHGDPLGAPQPPHRSCAVEGCTRRRQSWDWCQMHYKRWRNHGDPLGAPHGRFGGALSRDVHGRRVFAAGVRCIIAAGARKGIRMRRRRSTPHASRLPKRVFARDRGRGPTTTHGVVVRRDSIRPSRSGWSMPATVASVTCAASRSQRGATSEAVQVGR
jgi:hypothetical protein